MVLGNKKSVTKRRYPICPHTGKFGQHDGQYFCKYCFAAVLADLGKAAQRAENRMEVAQGTYKRTLDRFTKAWQSCGMELEQISQ